MWRVGVILCLYLVASAKLEGIAVGPQKTTLLRKGKKIDVRGGIDFSLAEFDEESGKRCIFKEVEVDTLNKEPLLECTHKKIEQCHYTYVTKFKPSKEEICDENYQKYCRITFKNQIHNETMRKCNTPVEKICNGQGPEECRTIYQSSCTTKYVEKYPGKFIGDARCEKLPVEVCGAGCAYEEGAEECHDKVVTSVVSIPEEICDLNPQTICRMTTKLVPSLTPETQCTIVPKETCHLSFSSLTPAKKTIRTKWCLDESDPTIINSLSKDGFPDAKSAGFDIEVTNMLKENIIDIEIMKNNVDADDIVLPDLVTVENSDGVQFDLDNTELNGSKSTISFKQDDDVNAASRQQVDYINTESILDYPEYFGIEVEVTKPSKRFIAIARGERKARMGRRRIRTDHNTVH